MSSYKYTFKVLLLGHPSVKKEFINMYFQQIFREDLSLTIGIEFYMKDIQFSGDIIRLKFWDISENERFRFLIKQYCKGANGTVLMYDITNSKSLENLVNFIQIIRENAGDIPIILIGNRVDLEKFREVSKEEGIKIAERYNLSAFTEISTKTDENVEKTFEVLTEIIINHFK